jgi:predicted DNA-binding transcriptional regulator AlpA
MQKTKAPRRTVPPGWLTREQVAIRIDRTVSAIDKMIIGGRLPQPYKFGNRCVMFSEAEIDAHLAKQEAEELAALAKRSTSDKVTA